MASLIGRSENIPHGHKHRGDDRTDDKAVNAENRHAPKGCDENHLVGHLGVFTDENLTQDVVH